MKKSRYKWIIKDPATLSLSRWQLLIAATPTWKNDYMRDGIRQCRKHGKNQYLAICLFDKELIGWAMLDFRLSGEKSVRHYIYVKTKYRRKGYGTIIFNKAKEIAASMDREIRVLPHDKRSKRFYKKAQIEKHQVVRGYTLK